ncbi:lipocalin family protein [Tenacibaculum maritimum]|uniref:lipocalin family protein n=1 Tax=Tenacibaculum maritimum TaxID=107401 RepID=UPI003876EF9F
MKNLLILCIAIVTLGTSCSSNDEKNLDPLVGSWYKFSENKKEVSDCEKKTTLNFKENGDYSISLYEALTNGDCISDGMDTGKWANKGNNNYGIILAGDNFEAIQKITFGENSSSFTFTEKEEDGTTYTTTYKRK